MKDSENSNALGGCIIHLIAAFIAIAVWRWTESKVFGVVVGVLVEIFLQGFASSGVDEVKHK